MSLNQSDETKPLYKYFRGKWKELGSDKTPLPQIEELEYCVKDFENKSIIELEELIIRQEKLIHNKLLLSKLKDKGEKIKKKYEVLQNALKIKKESESLVSRINNQDLDEDINNIEWSGLNKSSNIYNNNLREVTVDSEDEEENNPLQLLARHSIDYPSTPRNGLKDEEDAIKLIEKELEKLNIEDSLTSTEKDTTCNLEEYSDGSYFGHKLLNTLNEKQKSNKKRVLFKPNRSNNGNKLGNEITVKVIPLEESLKLLSEASKNEQIMSYSEAAEALKNSKPIVMKLPSTNYLNYRDTNSPQHFLDADDDDINESLYFGRVTED